MRWNIAPKTGLEIFFSCQAADCPILLKFGFCYRLVHYMGNFHGTGHVIRAENDWLQVAMHRYLQPFLV